jgi:ABC-type antimicrobial peptide transport system permease subunit
MRSLDNARDYLKNHRKYRAIKLRVLLHIAWKNFTSKKLRSFLTVFGVVIGISAIFFLLTFGLGIQSLVTKEVVGDKSLKAIDVDTPNSKVLQLNEQAINTFKTYPHVERVGVQYSFPGIMSYNGSEVDSVVYGLNQDYQNLTTMRLADGRLLNDSDSRAIVINTSALKVLGVKEDESAINKQILMTIPLERAGAREKSITDTFTVVGVIESGSGSEVFMPSSLFDVAGVPTYQNAKVVIDDLANIDTARKQIESSGYQTSSLNDTISEIDRIFKFFNLILISFGSIGMVVAVLGMFNTLTISLLERTKEIGLMMALGARRSDMRKLFIFEAVLISLAGAVAGIIIAIIGGEIVNAYINAGARGRGVSQSFDLFSTPLWAILAIIGFTVLVGLLVVYFPARRAEKTNPIDALRRE